MSKYLQKHKEHLALVIAIAVILISVLSIKFVFAQSEDAEEPCTLESCGNTQEITDTGPECTKDTWICADWRACSLSGSQTRTCTLTSDCEDVDTPSPDEKRSCIPPVQPAPQPEQESQPQVKAAPPPTPKQVVAPSPVSSPPKKQPPAPILAPQPSPPPAPEVHPVAPVEAAPPAPANEQDQQLQQGTPPNQFDKQINKELREERAKIKLELVRKISEDVYKTKIIKDTQDTNGDGVPDIIKIQYGLDPTKQGGGAGDLSAFELKLYNTTPELLDTKCTLSTLPGTKLSSDGFSILAACPVNGNYTLYLKGEDGNEFALVTQATQENHKVAFTVERHMQTGKFELQIRPTLTINGEASDPVPVYIVDDSELGITLPIIKAIEDVKILQGVRNVTISATKDGRVRVTGVADLASTVIGTFQSATFTSAMLADTVSGSFEIISPSPLEVGDHAVTLYSAYPEENAQSAPVRIPFAIIAAARGAAENLPTPPLLIYSVIAVVVLALIVTIIIILLKKRKSKQQAAEAAAAQTQEVPVQAPAAPQAQSLEQYVAGQGPTLQ